MTHVRGSGIPTKAQIDAALPSWTSARIYIGGLTLYTFPDHDVDWEISRHESARGSVASTQAPWWAAFDKGGVA